ncbi:MAG: XdhC family protein [Myxococcales bacterium]|nr:XdhC family protein [Myxococcales bacterium]
MRVLALAPVFAQKHKNAALVTVVASSGSTPRHPGTHMLVSADGAQRGTIGGGRVELEIVAVAQAVAGGALVAHATHNLVRDLGMCCGGSMSFFTQPLAPCLSAIAELVERRSSRLSSWAEMNLERGGMEIRTSQADAGSERVFRLHVRPSPRVVLLGCGHLSRAIGPLAADLGFKVVLCDDNQTSAIDELPAWADVLVPSFELRDIEKQTGRLGTQDYVLILTRDHGIDQRIVEACLPRIDDLAYLGLIGSQGKIGRFRKRILAKDIATEAQWGKLHGPIGLDIAAETPIEIAVSILAQLVRVKNSSLSEGEV